jgi:hypothetical protein
MPTPTKFTAETRQKILQALQVGASRTTSAHIAGVDEAQVRRWIAKGKDAAPGTRFREFYEAVIAAEASPRMRALGIIYKEMPDRPDLAWKYIERREPGYAPPMPSMPPPSQGPVIIQLALADGGRLQLPSADVIEGEVVDEQDEQPGAAPPAPA